MGRRETSAGPVVSAVIDSPARSQRDLVIQLLRAFGVVSRDADPSAIASDELVRMLERFLAGLAPLGAVAEVKIRLSSKDRVAIVEHLKALNLGGQPLLSLDGAPSDAADDTVSPRRRVSLATSVAIAGLAALIGVALSALLVYRFASR